MAVCLRCHAPLKRPFYQGTPVKYCSARCRGAAAGSRRRAKGYRDKYAPHSFAQVRDCKVCETAFVARSSSTVFCSTECLRASNAAKQRARYAADPEWHITKSRRNRAEMTPEQIAAEKIRKREWAKQAGYFEAKREGDQRRRARKAGAVTEKFATFEIFERDEWQCGICVEAVDKSLKYPDPRSPSLDHIIPLSFDGDHTRANVRLAHLICNIRRGNREMAA